MHFVVNCPKLGEPRPLRTFINRGLDKNAGCAILHAMKIVTGFLTGWRTGPELQLEYYTTGNAFIYAGLNYDLFTHTASGGWETAGANALRYSFGIGIAF